LRETAASKLKRLERSAPLFAIHIEDEHPGLGASRHCPIAIRKSLEPEAKSFFLVGGLMGPVVYQRSLVASLHRE
jgi:hypothetical protein